MKISKETIGFITAIIALIAAVISLTQTVFNRQELKRQGEEIRAMQVVTSQVALSLQIDSPKDRSVIDKDIIMMEGTFKGQLPYGYKLWILAMHFQYYMMYPPTQFRRTMGKWSQTNVRLTSKGRWELHVCVANEEASSWFEAKASRGDFSGFPRLPSVHPIIGNFEAGIYYIYGIRRFLL